MSAARRPLPGLQPREPLDLGDLGDLQADADAGLAATAVVILVAALCLLAGLVHVLARIDAEAWGHALAPLVAVGGGWPARLRLALERWRDRAADLWCAWRCEWDYLRARARYQRALELADHAEQWIVADQLQRADALAELDELRPLLRARHDRMAAARRHNRARTAGRRETR